MLLLCCKAQIASVKVVSLASFGNNTITYERPMILAQQDVAQVASALGRFPNWHQHRGRLSMRSDRHKLYAVNSSQGRRCFWKMEDGKLLTSCIFSEFVCLRAHAVLPRRTVICHCHIPSVGVLH